MGAGLAGVLMVLKIIGMILLALLLLLLLALLLPAGWSPDAELKTRGPRRDDLLFGHWPLP